MSRDERARVRAGDRDAFGELFDRYARTVYNHGFRLTADWSMADDVVSATFLEAWRLRARVDPDGGSLRPWLLGIATNVSRNLRRSDRRYRAAALALAHGEQAAPDHADGVGGRLDDGRRIAAAVAALATLRRAEREVLVLCLWEGLDYAGAAAALGIPVGTVRSRLSRAREKLRRLTGAQDGEREPAGPVRQEKGDRTNAARTAEEGTR
jgi:RNA polymerase sigma-70 factor (ECF subfamily)